MREMYIKLLVLEIREVLEVNSIVSEQEVNYIKSKIAEVDGLISIQELRDGVVMYTDDRKAEFRALGNWEQFDSYNNTMSKIVAVIDSIR